MKKFDTQIIFWTTQWNLLKWENIKLQKPIIIIWKQKKETLTLTDFIKPGPFYHIKCMETLYAFSLWRRKELVNKNESLKKLTKLKEQSQRVWNSSLSTEGVE